MFSHCRHLTSVRVITNFAFQPNNLRSNGYGRLSKRFEIMLNTLVTMPYTVNQLAVDLLNRLRHKKIPSLDSLPLPQALWESTDITLSNRPHLARVDFALRAASPVSQATDPEGRPLDEFVTLLDKEIETLKLRLPRLTEKSLISFSTAFEPRVSLLFMESGIYSLICHHDSLTRFNCTIRADDPIVESL